MGEESCEMHPEDDTALLEKNKKRIVKTCAQVEALEKFYNDHKYPSEPMKLQLAECIGLTEKQVSGWFCHRRLKDKKLVNGGNYATGRQDRSSGVIQDHGSGYRQDSCGSTKQGNAKNFDSREVESGRLTSKDFSAAGLTFEQGSRYAGNYNRADDASSGSSSSLQNVPNHQSGDLDAARTRYLIPKFPLDIKGLKTRSSPSGYLKVKGPVENAAVTAVKRQLGKHYREDGPPLGVEFDPLPPGAFECSVQDPVEDDYCTKEAAPPASPDFSNVLQNPKFFKGSAYRSSMAFSNSNVDGTSFKRTRGYDIPDSCSRPKSRIKTSLYDNGTYHPRSYSSVELQEDSARDIPGGESRDEYGSRCKQGLEVMTAGSVLDLPYGGKLREKQAVSWSGNHNDVDGGNTENEYSNLTMKRNEYRNPGEIAVSREILKDAKRHSSRGTTNENKDKTPFNNDSTGSQWMREEFAMQPHLKKSSVVDTQPHAHHFIRSTTGMPSSSSSEDEEIAGTSSLVD